MSRFVIILLDIVIPVRGVVIQLYDVSFATTIVIRFCVGESQQSLFKKAFSTSHAVSIAAKRFVKELTVKPKTDGAFSRQVKVCSRWS